MRVILPTRAAGSIRSTTYRAAGGPATARRCRVAHVTRPRQSFTLRICQLPAGKPASLTIVADSRDSSSFETLGHLVVTFAARGERAAIVAFRPDGVEQVSYAALGERIAHVAHGLRARGIATGERVALWAANSPHWITAYFGIVTAGAVAVTLDHQSTAETVATAMAHAEV